MGWFSPVKGSYPSLAQVDKALPVLPGNTAIERGTIVALAGGDEVNSTEGAWKIAEATDKVLYVALQDYSDPTAGFAGSTFDPNGGTPKINGIDLHQDGEYETSVFDSSIQDYAVGDELYVGEGGILTKTKAEGAQLVGIVTLAPTTRWINNAIALPADQKDPRLAIRTGANKPVIRFKTAG